MAEAQEYIPPQSSEEPSQEPLELTEADINQLEFQAYNDVLDGVDNFKQELGLEHGSLDYKRAGEDYKFARQEFERKYGQSPEEATPTSLFGKLKMFIKPSMRRDLKAYRQAETKLHAIENNIINIAPGIFKNSEAYNKILKSAEASKHTSQSQEQRLSLLKKKIERDNKVDHTTPANTRMEKIQRIVMIEEKTKQVEVAYDQAIEDSKIELEENEMVGARHLRQKEPAKTIKPGIMNDERGEMIHELGDLDQEKRLENIALENMSEPMKQMHRKIQREMKMVDAIHKSGAGLIDFNGQKMLDSFYNIRATQDRLESTLKFNPTQGSRIKAWIGAVRKLGLEGMSTYQSEMKQFDNAQKELSQMESDLEKALNEIRYSNNPRLQMIGKLLDKESSLRSLSREMDQKHRDCYVNIKLKAYELSQDKAINIGDAETRLSSTTGVINENTNQPRQFQQTDLVFKFDMAIAEKTFQYGVFCPDPNNQDNPYFFQEIKSEK